MLSGRKVKVTEYHNFFTLSKDCELRQVATKDLRAGSKIAVAGSIPIKMGINVLDLAKMFGDRRDLHVRGRDGFKLVLNSIKEENKDLTKYNNNINATDNNFKIFEPVGCEKCNLTGYHGRIGIFEAIKTDEAIEKIILENPSEREIKKIAKNQNILSMRQDGIIKVLNGVTSLEEVQAVVDLLEE